MRAFLGLSLLALCASMKWPVVGMSSFSLCLSCLGVPEDLVSAADLALLQMASGYQKRVSDVLLSAPMTQEHGAEALSKMWSRCMHGAAPRTLSISEKHMFS
jgi:hypothetical protein